MAQYDFGTIDPNTKSGTALASDLNSWRNAVHSTHSAATAPSYLVAGMLWADTTSANYELKMYDGAQWITVAVLDATNNVARVAVDPAETSYITSTTSGQIRHLIASADVFTIRSTGVQFNIASPVIADSNNNELISLTTTASAVNQINIANAATGANPVISAVGNDTNIGITLTPKGTGRTNIGQLALDGTTITTTAAELNFVDGVTSSIQTQLNAKAPLASPTFTGVPAAPTATAGTNTTQVATTAFVQTALSGAGVASINVQEFTAGGTWTKPANALYSEITVVGGGRAGQVGAVGSMCATGAIGIGGNAGGAARLTKMASALGATETVTIGAGGATSLAVGGTSSFGAHASATGGGTSPGIGSGTGAETITGGRSAGNSSASTATVPDQGYAAITLGGSSISGPGGVLSAAGIRGGGGGGGFNAATFGAGGAGYVRVVTYCS